MTDSGTKFHITKKGVIEACGASVRPCPLGGQHFACEEAAQDYLAFEAEAEAKAEFQREFEALQLDTVKAGEEVEVKDRWGQK